jgi:hypothetical protein
MSLFHHLVSFHVRCSPSRPFTVIKFEMTVNCFALGTLIAN